MIKRVQAIGQRVAEAQPREIAVSNIVRRVLGVIREEAEGDEGAETGSLIGDSSTPETPKEPVTHIQSGVAYPFQNDLSLGMRLEGASFASAETEASHRPPLLTSHTSYATSTTAPTVTSMFSLLSHPLSSRGSTPGTQSPIQRGSPRPSILPPSHDTSKEDLRAEVSNGIEEIIDEISIVDDQIASYAPEHIHENEIILTHGSSFTVQKFLLKAASKRKFTVIHAEGFPNTHREVHALVTGKGPNGVPLTTDPSSEDDLGLDRFSKPLIAAGITVILIPDAAVFALMSRVNKVILGTHIVLANGGLIAIAGSKVIAKAAHEHRTPVVVVTGVYKLSPTYPFDFDALIEHGEPGPVLGWDEDGEYVEKIDVENPLHDYVPGELVDLYVTNLGGCAPFALASVVEEQYRAEDLEIGSVWQGK
ncbi:GCD complex subunit gcd7 [Thelotrema lepadinum]|nr:GCD complex subunit gcd7 [Thelotrema lepadinum]